MSVEDGNLTLREATYREAQKWIGARARKFIVPEMGLTPLGFDCSGFNWFCLNQVYGRVNIPFPEDIRTANDFHDRFGQLISRGPSEPGDTLCFYDLKRKFPSHVGIMGPGREYIDAKPELIQRVRLGNLDKLPFENDGKLVLSAVRRPALKFGRWLLADPTLDEITELTKLANPAEVDVNDLEVLGSLLEGLSDSNSLKKNIAQLYRLAEERNNLGFNNTKPEPFQLLTAAS